MSNYSTDTLGNRLKAFEAVWDQKLPKDLPVIIRLDGSSFHTFTEAVGFQKPLDERMVECMKAAMQAVMEYCSGSTFGYTQSDEISILVYSNPEEGNDAFLANRVQKITSLTAAVASVAFNARLRLFDGAGDLSPFRPAHFDSRVFVVPPDAVHDALQWRQKDAFKNCVSMYVWHGLKAKYGPEQAEQMLHGMSTNQRQEVLFQECGINIDKVPTHHKRGVGMYRRETSVPLEEAISMLQYLDLVDRWPEKAGELVTRKKWFADLELPQFNQNPEFIRQFVTFPKLVEV